MACKFCNDGSGSCIYPYYGQAPKRGGLCYPTGDFKPDDTRAGLGTYIRCPECSGSAEGDKMTDNKIPQECVDQVNEIMKSFHLVAEPEQVKAKLSEDGTIEVWVKMPKGTEFYCKRK